jgi:transcriptional regulator with XRE-family HTH domain
MTSLREARAKRLLSIRELARMASVAPSTIYLIESGRTVPRPRVVRSLITVLSVALEDIEEFRRAIELSQTGGQRADRARPAEYYDGTLGAIRSGVRQAVADASNGSDTALLIDG